MGRIQLLPAEIVTKIAAGEVIERPASVVKELLENAVDAGASRIDVELEGGGIDRICVVDNGCGMLPDDLPLAFAAHATSKLQCLDDLFAIQTLGFRGEALASIGSVAQVLLQSRAAEATEGASIRCDGGQLSELRPWNGPQGTRIDVRHLFYNVPVRRKFLKSTATELGHVCECVIRLALARPDIHITLRHNGKGVYDLPPTVDIRDRIALFFGAEVRDALYDISGGDTVIRLSGYVADPSCDRGHPRMQYFFVNRRWFRDRTIGHALQEAYRGLLMTGRYPVAFLYLSMPPQMVDVNVHPTKAEVRFPDSSLIYSLVRGTVHNRLMRANLLPTMRLDSANVPHGPVAAKPAAVPLTVATGLQSLDMPSPHRDDPPPRLAPLPQYDPPQTLPPVASAPPPSCGTAVTPNAATQPDATATLPATMPTPEPISHIATPAANSPPLQPVLQIQDTYIVLETDAGMLVIDQHALHERILYEQLRQRVMHKNLEVQRLLVPEPIDLPPEQAALLLAVTDALASLGIEVSEFGGNTVLVHSYPTLLSARPVHEIVAGIVDHLMRYDRLPSRETLLHDLLATIACKAAIKAGDRLSPEEIHALLRLRDLAEHSQHCPHGRPTTLLISREQLDRQFRRT